MKVRLAGNVICARLALLSKASPPMEITPSGKVICVRFVLSKAVYAMEVSPVGSVIFPIAAGYAIRSVPCTNALPPSMTLRGPEPIRVKELSDVQPTNGLPVGLELIFTEAEKVRLVRLVQSLKALALISVSPAGRVIWTRLVQPAKTSTLISVSPAGRLVKARLVQPLKA